jgi:hypothetical protein
LQTKIALSYTSSDKLIGIELFIIYIYFWSCGYASSGRKWDLRSTEILFTP